jgi:iron complex outermembrane receptor protein
LRLEHIFNQAKMGNFMNQIYSERLLLAGVSSLCFLALAMPANAASRAGAAAANSGDVDAANNGPITNNDDIVVTATKVNQETPITASLHTFEPQAIVSRSIIENSIAPTADYSQVIILTPGASLAPSSGNGVGLGDVKVTLRGFKDGQYNITYDGVPFGDSNDPTHHSTSYFPNGTYDRIIVDRGPGSATDLGQASYGGQVHIISREPTDHRFVEGHAVYGSFNTNLERLTVNTGAMERLGGLKIIAVGEFKGTKGALSNQSGKFANGYFKAELALGPDIQVSLLANYNQSLYHQSDAAGGATQAQINAFGKNYGATNPTTAAASGYPNARNDWNWQNKTTDMEIARFQWNMSEHLSFDNKAYTYFYKNFTLSTEDSTTLCNVVSTSNQCSGAGFKNAIAMGAGAGGSGGKAVAGDIPGYTKLNQYRTSGDIAQLDYKTSIGTAKVGVWYEYSYSKRYRYDYDFTAASNNGAFGNYYFNFAAMANYYNYKESVGPTNIMLNGMPVPAYIKYDERTSWNQVQGFGEFEFKLLDNRLTITPGIKVQKFTREIHTPIAAQGSRHGSSTEESYKPTLPYATVNFLVTPNLSVYGQYAKGFIIPALSASLETKGANNAFVPLQPLPTKTTNYQAGFVYAGDRLNIDADAYYIKASNSTTVDPTNSNNVTINANPAIYKGVEGKVSYLVMPGLTAIANGTIMSSKDDVTKLWLTTTPNYTALLGAVYNTEHFKFSYLHKFTGREFIDALNTQTIPAYSYGVLSGSVTFGQITAGVTVNNVWDSQPVIVNSGGLYIFQTRRSYQAQLKFRF